MENIKRIIFDLDNTLIPWSNDYLEAVKKAVEEFAIAIPYEKMDDAYATYESFYVNYTFKNFQEHIKKQLGIEVPIEFIKKWMEYLGDMAMQVDLDLKETLEYLREKYSLVVLTNGFTDSQAKRLKTAGIREYFEEIYGGEEFMKPDRKSYLRACGAYNPQECIMIGDTYKTDYQGAIEAGLNAIFYDRKDTDIDVPKVGKLSELRQIL